MRILSLSLALLVGLSVANVAVAAAAPTKTSTKPSHHTAVSSKSRTSAHTAQSSHSTKSSTTKSKRRDSKWKVSSYGNPTEGDNPAGEDPDVREAAVEGLAKWNGSAVVVDPNTGRILSIVNQKAALSSAVPPCSTFKPIVGLAALKEGIITEETQIKVGRRKSLSLTDALAHSNNRFFQKLGEALGFQRLKEIGQRFGFGEKAGVDIPGESAGKFPETYPKETGVGLMSSHGKAIGATPLQMAAAMSAIANGGTLYELQYPRTPEEIQSMQPQVRGKLDDLVDYFPLVKQGLAATVLYGTGRHAYDPDSDWQVLGKTGSCSENGTRLGWFVSYSAEPQPKYVVVVLLKGGRIVYGPTAAQIAGHIYHNLRLREHSPAQAQVSAPAFATILKTTF
jgi:penicillin-binding protein 2